MLALENSTLCTLLLAGAAALALGCSADAASPDASTGTSIDARSNGPRPDAEPFNFPDADLNAPDASPGCVDSHEANETSATAKSLSSTPVSASDSAGGAITGVAIDPDVDWFTYQGDDDAYIVDPTVQVIPADKVEVCMYFDCVADVGLEFSCPDGASASTDGELTGCCSGNGFTVDDLDCGGFTTPSDDTFVYIRVKPATTGVCQDYSITYHY